MISCMRDKLLDECFHCSGIVSKSLCVSYILFFYFILLHSPLFYFFLLRKIEGSVLAFSMHQ